MEFSIVVNVENWINVIQHHSTLLKQHCRMMLKEVANGIQHCY